MNRSRPSSRAQVGRRGEELAASHLVSLGWRIIERNWRCRYGELDIIAVEGLSLVVVEVKTRTGGLYGDPSEAVTMRKVARMRSLTSAWLSQQQHRWETIRFDIVGVRLRSSGTTEFVHHRGIC